jgi:hypothetical protein
MNMLHKTKLFVLVRIEHGLPIDYRAADPVNTIDWTLASSFMVRPSARQQEISPTVS